MSEAFTTEPAPRPAPRPAPAPSGSRSAMMIVFLVVVIDLLGFGIVLPLLPVYGDSYVSVLVPGGHDTPTGGMILGLLMAAFSAMQFVFAPLWGRLSDRIGRRPILLIGLGGSVVFYLLFAYASELSPSTSALTALIMLFAARIGQGVSGATISTAQAVIADTTTPEKRKHGMALIGAAFGIGFTFGPLVASAALWLFPENRGSTGVAAALLSLVALVLGVAVLPETRKFGAESAARRNWLDLMAWQYALGSRALAPVVLCFFLATLGFAGFEVTLALLNKESLTLTAVGSGFIFAFVGFTLIVAQGGIYQVMARRLTEPSLMAWGIVCMGLGVMSLGGVTLAANAGTFDVREWAFFTREAGPADLLGASAGGASTLTVDVTPDYLIPVTLVALALAVIGFALLTPSAQALISRRADADHQGEILGVNQSASALAHILGPVIGLTLYKLSPTHLLPYLFGGTLVLLMLPLIPRIRRG